MTVKISKPALNLREELNKLDKPSGITGETLLRADTGADARATLGVDNFEQVSVSTDGVISADSLTTTGNVGIGTSSPAKTLSVAGSLQVDSGAANSDVSFIADDGYDVYLGFGTAADRYASYIRKDLGPTKQLTISAETTLGLKTNDVERMRIDSAGNLLVNTTNPAAGYENTEAGIVLGGSDNYTIFSRTGNIPLFLNRNSTDGTIADFRKDGTSVGSIGTISGDLAIYSSTTGHNGLRLGLGAVLPTNNAGVVADNSADLGNSIYRFKNLYLSGGVHLGGTGAANKLDDYEEGTWTPTVGGTWTTAPTTLSGTYIKVGSLVYVKVQFLSGAKSSAVAGWIDGLPFNQIDGGATGSVSDAAVNDLGNCLFANTTRIWFTATSFSGTTYVSGCYNTDA